MDSKTEDHDDREVLGGAPVTPEDDELREKCRTDRSTLTPRQTADCAGSDLAESYENEEDGGS